MFEAHRTGSSRERPGLALWLLFLMLAPTPARGGEVVELAEWEVGRTLERPIRVGEVHAYRVALAARQLFGLVLERQGVALVATVIRPDGEKLPPIGSTVSREGPLLIEIFAETAGDHRVELRTFSKPSPPGTYRVSLVPPGEAIRRAAQASCRQRRWHDETGHFLVDKALRALAECMDAVSRGLASAYPEASEIAAATRSEVEFVSARWRWGDFVSQAYEDSVIADFQALAKAASKGDAEIAHRIQRQVAEDVKIKADHCRMSPGSLGRDVEVVITTRKSDRDDMGWLVYFKPGIFEFDEGRPPDRFPQPSGPQTRHELPPGRYLLWAEKPVSGVTAKSAPDSLKVGDGRERLDWTLIVPDP